MECRKFEIKLESATNLGNVRKIFKMKVYAKVSIQGGSENEKLTPTDTNGETNPTWNFTMRYTISESMVQNYNAMFVVKLYCKRKLGDRYIGEVYTSIKELFDCSRNDKGSADFTLPVRKGSEQSQGGLKVSCTFGEIVVIDRLLLSESVEGWTTLAV